MSSPRRSVPGGDRALAAAGTGWDGARSPLQAEPKGERARERRLVGGSLETGAVVARPEAENAELERFVDAVAHDLKSPLLTILSFLDLARQEVAAVVTDPGAAERLAGNLGWAAAAAHAMQRLIDDLLELSRAGRLVGSPQAVPLGDLAREAAALLAGPITERGVRVMIAPDLPVVRGDRTRLLEVFQNLLANAVKYMGEQVTPRVEVGFRAAEGAEAVCYVRDNGTGIAAEDQEKIFGLFERLAVPTAGTGIGLALVRRIVEAHGGRTWVESEGAGHGSTFCFTVPRGSRPADSRAGA